MPYFVRFVAAFLKVGWHVSDYRIDVPVREVGGFVSVFIEGEPPATVVAGEPGRGGVGQGRGED